MKVSGVSASYFSTVNSTKSKNNQPSFKATLNVASDVAVAYHYLGGNISWFGMKVSQLAKCLKNLPDKPIFVALSEAASNDVKRGIAPKEPALEIFIGKFCENGNHTVESQKVKANLGFNNFEGTVYYAAKTLISE